MFPFKMSVSNYGHSYCSGTGSTARKEAEHLMWCR